LHGQHGEVETPRARLHRLFAQRARCDRDRSILVARASRCARRRADRVGRARPGVAVRPVPDRYRAAASRGASQGSVARLRARAARDQRRDARGGRGARLNRGGGRRMARAMWKGILTIGEERIAVKLFAAVEDRTVRFRLLHEEDGVPVKQRLVEPESEEIVEYAETERAFLTPERDLVVLHRDELEALEPAASREIEILRFVPTAAVDERWYERPYFLGPDGDARELAALAAAMRETERIGIARWVMRKKEYRGALRVADDGVPMLIMLRSADEVIVASEL